MPVVWHPEGLVITTAAGPGDPGGTLPTIETAVCAIGTSGLPPTVTVQPARF